jgi:hypothetical protein
MGRYEAAGGNEYSTRARKIDCVESDVNRQARRYVSTDILAKHLDDNVRVLVVGEHYGGAITDLLRKPRELLHLSEGLRFRPAALAEHNERWAHPLAGRDPLVEARVALNLCVALMFEDSGKTFPRE